MVQSGDIYSGEEGRQRSPWKKHRKSSHRKKESSPNSKTSQQSASSSTPKHLGHTERKALKKQRKRRTLTAAVLLVLGCYIVYVGMIALQGAFKYGGGATEGISPLAKFFERAAPVEISPENKIITDNGAADVNFQDFINSIDRSAQIQANVRNLINKGLMANALDRVSVSGETLIRSSEINMLIAKAQIGEHQYKAAIATLREVLSNNPENLDARLRVAEAFAKLGQYKDSAIVAEWTIELSPTSEIAHKLAATGYKEMQMPEKAIRHYQSILNIRPGDEETRSQLAIAYYDAGEYGRSIKYLNEMVQRNTENSLAYYNLSLCYAKQNLVEKVVQTLTYAERKFGKSFVKAWVQGEEFKHLHRDPKFIMFAAQLSEQPEIAKRRVRDSQEKSISATFHESEIEFNPYTDINIIRKN